jgi:hypothetical protein
MAVRKIIGYIAISRAVESASGLNPSISAYGRRVKITASVSSRCLKARPTDSPVYQIAQIASKASRFSGWSSTNRMWTFGSPPRLHLLRSDSGSHAGPIAASGRMRRRLWRRWPLHDGPFSRPRSLHYDVAATHLILAAPWLPSLLAPVKITPITPVRRRRCRLE